MSNAPGTGSAGAPSPADLAGRDAAGRPPVTEPDPLAVLADLDSRPLREHVAAFDRVHRALAERLDDAER